MDHDHVVVVSVGAGGREDDGEDQEDEVRVSEPHGALVTPEDTSSHVTPGSWPHRVWVRHVSRPTKELYSY